MYTYINQTTLCKVYTYLNLFSKKYLKIKRNMKTNFYGYSFRSFSLIGGQSNLLCMVIKRFVRVSAKAHLVLSLELQEIIVGSLLGDLGCERPSPRGNTRMQFKQSTKNREYIEHLYSLFSEFCGSSPLVMSKFDSRPSKLKRYFAIKFQTLCLPCFNIYRDVLEFIGCVRHLTMYSPARK